MPNLMGLGAGLSGFAEGFGNEFARAQDEKRRAEQEMAKTFLTLGMHDPSIAASPEFEKMLTKGFGKEGAQHSMTLIQHAEAARKANAALPFAPAGTTLEDLMTGGGQSAPSPAPAAGGDVTPASAPAAPAPAPETNIQAFRRRNRESGIKAAPFPGTKMVVQSALTEPEKENAFGPIFDATLNHVAGYVPKKDREIVAYHAVLDTLRHAGRLEMVPNRVWKLLNVDEQDIRKQDRELANAGPKAAAAAAGRESVTGPAEAARHARNVGEESDRHYRNVVDKMTADQRAADREQKRHDRNVVDKMTAEQRVADREQKRHDRNVQAQIDKEQREIENQKKKIITNVKDYRDAQGRQPPPGITQEEAAAGGYEPIDPAMRSMWQKMKDAIHGGPRAQPAGPVATPPPPPPQSAEDILKKHGY